MNLTPQERSILDPWFTDMDDVARKFEGTGDLRLSGQLFTKYGFPIYLVGQTIISANDTISSIDFDVPADGSHLLLIVSGGTTHTGDDITELRIRFNGDSGANYNGTAIYALASVPTALELTGITYGVVTAMAADGAPADGAAGAMFWVHNYNSILNKNWNGFGYAPPGDGDSITALQGGFWENTDKIRRITIYDSNDADFQTSSSFSLFVLP